MQAMESPIPTQVISPRGQILIVEDDPLSRELMRIVLNKYGYEVTQAANGSEAVTNCQRISFDMVFMDLQMPDMDGFATATKIREVEQPGKRVPIVALTASNISSLAYEHFKTEFERILTKPFEIPTILRAIEDFAELKNDERLVSDQPEINIREGLRHFGLDQEQYREIFDEFLESLTGRLEDMNGSLCKGDLNGLARHAHNLKGVSANVGVMRLSEAAARLDDASSEADARRIDQTLEEVASIMRILQNTAQDSLNAFFNTVDHTRRDE